MGGILFPHTAEPQRFRRYNPPTMRVLITAGNTRERIDDVRDWGNIFTGNTGYGIAKAIAQVAEVDLLTSNSAHLSELAAAPSTPHRITGSSFKTHEELR